MTNDVGWTLLLSLRRLRGGNLMEILTVMASELHCLTQQRLLTPAPSHASANGFIREVKISDRTLLWSSQISTFSCLCLVLVWLAITECNSIWSMLLIQGRISALMSWVERHEGRGAVATSNTSTSPQPPNYPAIFYANPRVCYVQHREQVLKLHPNIEEFLTHIGGASCQIFTTKILSVH